jgi:glycosyltransferase involved in cell wall biosynthesis
MAMRAWVVENGLVDQTGHHFNNSIGLRDACAERGIETRFLVHRHADPAVVKALDARAIFDFGPYDLVSNDPLAGPLENLIVQGQSFAQALAEIAAGFVGDDLVVVPSTLQNELYGCALGFAQIPAERRPRLALTFIVDNFFAPGTRKLGFDAALYRFAARQLARVAARDRVLLGANGEESARSFAEVLALPVVEFPIPKAYPPQVAGRALDGTTPVVAILGHSRAEKGFQLVPDLVARNPGLRFVVQIAPADADAMWNERAAMMRSAANAELVRGALDAADYHALMRRADIVLLPYDAMRMPLRSSGVFAEAVASGKVTVVPDRTWMAAHLSAGRGAGTTFDAFDPGAISAALEIAVARHAELSAHAALAAPLWRERQSAGAYVERVLRSFGVRAGDEGPSVER